MGEGQFEASVMSVNNRIVVLACGYSFLEFVFHVVVFRNVSSFEI